MPTRAAVGTGIKTLCCYCGSTKPPVGRAVTFRRWRRPVAQFAPAIKRGAVVPRLPRGRCAANSRRQSPPRRSARNGRCPAVCCTDSAAPQIAGRTPRPVSIRLSSRERSGMCRPCRAGIGRRNLREEIDVFGNLCVRCWCPRRSRSWPRSRGATGARGRNRNRAARRDPAGQQRVGGPPVNTALKLRPCSIPGRARRRALAASSPSAVRRGRAAARRPRARYSLVPGSPRRGRGARYQSAPWARMWVTCASVSTLLMTVGQPSTPDRPDRAACGAGTGNRPRRSRSRRSPHRRYRGPRSGRR